MIATLRWGVVGERLKVVGFDRPMGSLFKSISGLSVVRTSSVVFELSVSQFSRL